MLNFYSLCHRLLQPAKVLFKVVYPPSCLHCQQETDRILCEACGTLLQLADTQPSWKASAFEYLGPSKSIVDEYRKGERPQLAQVMASYMALQFFELKWPTPDLIVPIPQHWLKRFDRTYDPAHLLAQELGKLLQVPVQPLLKRRIGGISQSKQSLDMRKKLPARTFRLKQAPIADKIILLVDDLSITGTTLRQCMRVLKEAKPQYIFGLTFSSLS